MRSVPLGLERVGLYPAQRGALPIGEQLGRPTATLSGSFTDLPLAFLSDSRVIIIDTYAQRHRLRTGIRSQLERHFIVDDVREFDSAYSDCAGCLSDICP